MKRMRFRHPILTVSVHRLADIRELDRILVHAGYDVCMRDAYLAWLEASEAAGAGWLIVSACGEQQALEKLLTYLEECT